MNKFRLITVIIIAAAFVPTAKAYMAAKSRIPEISMGIAPIEQRGDEQNFYTLLSNSGRKYESWIRDGNQYLKRSEYEQAIWAYRKAVKLRPASQEARFLLAVAYEKRFLEGLPGDYTDWENLAASEYEAAIEVADHLPARFNLAILKRRQGKFEEARINLEHILLVGKPGDRLVKNASDLLKEIFEQDVRPNSLSMKVSANSEELCRE